MLRFALSNNQGAALVWIVIPAPNQGFVFMVNLDVPGTTSAQQNSKKRFSAGFEKNSLFPTHYDSHLREAQSFVC